MTPRFQDMVASRCRAELARRARLPVANVTDDVALVDLGIDSFSLIEALLAVADEIMPAGADEVADWELPWVETVGDVVAFIATVLDSAVCETTPLRIDPATSRAT